MKWRALPGPGSFINRVLEHVRSGVSTVVATPLLVPQAFEDAITSVLDQDRWSVQRCHFNSQQDPLTWLTDQLYFEPASWVDWSIESLFERLSPHQVIAIDGVTDVNWAAWRAFLRDFEVASRRRASDERAVLLLFARGVPQKRLQIAGAALALEVWAGVFGELDMLVYVDQQLRMSREAPRHHKLIVRQIAALALWDLELANVLVEHPSSDLFNVSDILQAARKALQHRGFEVAGSWEQGGIDSFDGVELVHPFVLIEQGDPRGELKRRLWTAQAAELLPLIELRRRDVARSLQRHIACPFWIDSDRKVNALDELEIGSLAYAAHTHKVAGQVRETVQWLADCRNALAHLQVLSAPMALDSRLHE
jgi:hypothetical protein